MNVSFFSELLSDITERGRRLIGAMPEEGGLPAQLLLACQELLSSRGEASGVGLAREILDRYAHLDETAREFFFLGLARDFGPNRDRLEALARAYLDRPSLETANALHAAAESRSQEAIRRLNLAPGGTAALVGMRADLLKFLPAHEELRSLDADFAHLFGSWFNRGFLVLKRIDWNTPASILSKIIQYEAVHAIDDWEDLRRRIEPADRRLFAFFHPALVDEPLIFVEVALADGIPEAIAPILKADRPVLPLDQASVAVFYSISNCQEGLRGISFGHFLIKQVVEELAREVPNLKTFVTLSPVPGFRRWLEAEAEKPASPLIGEAERELLAALDAGWPPEEEERLRRLMLPLAAHYLVRARGRERRPLDPVARFHIGNGARLERIHWPADLSAQGMKRSAGLMVNYLYDPRSIEANHEAYANDGVVATSGTVRRLLRGQAEAIDPVPAE
jgi:malonyl-CoA decarboxylase